jgi:hypothetical protein
VRAPRPALRLLALICLAAVALGGCGDSADDSTGSTPSSGSQQDQPGKSTFTAKPHHDSGGGSAQFEVKGGDNSIQEFGEEGSESELQKAAVALHGFLDSRAEGDYGAACSYLDPEIAKSLQQLAAAAKEVKSAACPQLLAAFSKGVPTSGLIEAAQANVGSLRIEGDQNFLIYRGVGKTVNAISMTKQGGEWKVAALSGTPLG